MNRIKPNKLTNQTNKNTTKSVNETEWHWTGIEVDQQLKDTQYLYSLRRYKSTLRPECFLRLSSVLARSPNLKQASEIPSLYRTSLGASNPCLVCPIALEATVRQCTVVAMHGKMVEPFASWLGPEK